MVKQEVRDNLQNVKLYRHYIENIRSPWETGGFFAAFYLPYCDIVPLSYLQEQIMITKFEDRSRIFVQKEETKHLEKLAKHVQNLYILLHKAEKKAKGKREGGCGCPSCKKRLISAQRKLQKAAAKYRAERVRLYGKHEDPEA